MDVKAISMTQAALDMHSANMETQKKTQLEQDGALAQQKNQDQSIRNLDQKYQDKLIKETAEKLNKKFELFDSSLKIEFDKDTGIKVVKIIDNETKQVIRQIPPETMLKIAKYIDEITGLLFDKKI